MAKTFEDLDGRIIEIDTDITSVEVNEDIVTGNISSYYVVVGDYKYEVSKKVYEAVERYIES